MFKQRAEYEALVKSMNQRDARADFRQASFSVYYKRKGVASPTVKRTRPKRRHCTAYSPVRSQKSLFRVATSPDHRSSESGLSPTEQKFRVSLLKAARDIKSLHSRISSVGSFTKTTDVVREPSRKSVREFSIKPVLTDTYKALVEQDER